MSTPALNTTSIYPLAVVQAVLAALAVCLDIPPLIWHCKHANFAAVVLIFFILLMNVFDFTNALIWPNDDMSSWYNGVGYCDIQVKLVWAGSTALPGAVVCILKKLAAVMDTRNVTLSPTKAQKRRDRVFDISLCVGIPVLSMIADFVVQSPRYYIIGITGCNGGLSNTWLSMCLINLPPLLITLWAVYYGVLIGLRLRKYRSRLEVLLSASHTSKNHFLRLFALALVLVIFILPIQIYFVVASWPPELVPFVWSEVHSHESYATILLIPSYGTVAVDHWVQLTNGILVFIFFGLGQDATTMYSSWATSLGLDRLVSRVGSASSSLLQKSSIVSFGSFSRGSQIDNEKQPGVVVLKTISSSSTTGPGDEELGVVVNCA